MREHQIVITLKPDQFIEVQRLSRAAGAKSMGMFVRQTLLSSLGIDGSPPPGAEVPAEDIKRLVGELQKVHGELKGFVAEALMKPYIPEPGEPAAEAGEAPEAAGDSTVDAGTQMYAESVPYEIVWGGSGDVGAGLPGAPAEEDTHAFEAPPAPLEELEQAGVEEDDYEFDQAKDSLERFARRAFAISPRLGAAEFPGRADQEPGRGATAAAAVPDPLDELLERATDGADEEYQPGRSTPPGDDWMYDEGESEPLAEDDETIDVPLSLAERGGSKEQGDSNPPHDQHHQQLPPAPPRQRPFPGTGDSPLSGGPPPRRR